MLILQIPNPCHENWDEMQPEEQGRFCLNCQKKVVDFTTMSDEAVKNYLLDKREEKTCGRFLASQIGRPLKNQTLSIDPHWYQNLPYSRQIFYAISLFFVLGINSCDFVTMGATNQNQTESEIGIDSTKAMDHPKVGMSILSSDDSTVSPPKMKQPPVSFIAPEVLKGDVAVIQRAPIQEIIDTSVKVMGKIAPPDSNMIEPVIMGGISAPPIPIKKDTTSNINQKPRQ